MELEQMSKEELDTLSYTDMAEYILKEKKNSMNTVEIFKKICTILDYSNDEYSEKIGDFYTSLTTDKRFVFLHINEWDLKARHSVQIVMDEDDDFEEEIEEDIDEEIEEDIDNENIDVPLDDEIDDEDDELEDLAVIEEEDLEE